MLSYAHGSRSTPLLGTTIGAALNHVATEFAHRDALISCHQDVRYTYGGLLDEVNRVARGLLALGVQRGDRVGIWSSNVAEWVLTQYAAAKVGAILVNVNPSYRLRELEYALNQSGISVLVAARRFRKTDYVEMLVSLMPELPVAGDGPLHAKAVTALRHVVYPGTDAEPGGVAWTGLVGRADRVPDADLRAREALVQFDDPDGAIGRETPPRPSMP